MSKYYTPEQWVSEKKKDRADYKIPDDLLVWVHISTWEVDEWQLVEYNKTVGTMFDVLIEYWG